MESAGRVLPVRGKEGVSRLYIVFEKLMVNHCPEQGGGAAAFLKEKSDEKYFYSSDEFKKVPTEFF